MIFFSFIFISWRLIPLQYCSGFCQTLTWISHGFTCVPHPDPPPQPPSPLHPSGSSQCTSAEHLSHALNLGWWSVSPLRTYAFKLWYLRWFLRVPWTARRSNQPLLKEINPGCSLERLLLKPKLQDFGHLMETANSLEKSSMIGKLEFKRRRGWQRMRWLDSISDSRDMNLSKLWEIVKDRGAWCTIVHSVAKI